MLKIALAFSFLAVSGFVLGGCDADTQPDFTVCESTYALCTTAACNAIPGEDDTVSCACEVKTGYSAGEEPCTGEVETSEGKQISSRYYPIKSYRSAITTGPGPGASTSRASWMKAMPARPVALAP